MPNLLFPTHATKTLEQTLGNATIAANTSVETAQSVGYAATNASTFLTTVNTGTKALSVGYILPYSLNTKLFNFLFLFYISMIV